MVAKQSPVFESGFRKVYIVDEAGSRHRRRAGSPSGTCAASGGGFRSVAFDAAAARAFGRVAASLRRTGRKPAARACEWRQPDVILIGDSFAHGACVDNNARISGHLARAGLRVVNLGLSGAGPLMELATLREYGPRLRPRVVVWTFFEGNDLQDLDLEGRDTALSSYLVSGHTQQLAERQRVVDSLLIVEFNARLARVPELLRNDRRHTRIHVLKLGTVRHTIGFPVRHTRRLPYTNDNYQLLERVLNEARSEVARWHGKLVLVFVPSRTRYEGVPRMDLPDADRIVAAMQRSASTVVDLRRDFAVAAERQSLWWHAYSHYSDGGYQLAGQAIGAAAARALYNTNKRAH
ncbi:MAG: hypothetical protein ACT4O1_15700 [Gemmatimonadota bacterium]